MNLRTLNNQDGIALGPILFIIAILAILAGVIAAGSGAFNANTNTESVKSKAETLIQIGQNLQNGMQRLVIENGVAPSGVSFDPTVTSGTNALFSPQGGGIISPSETALCASCYVAGATSLWNYPGVTFHWILQFGNYPGFSSTGNNSYAFFAPVDSATCTQINSLVNGIATPSGVNLGTMWPQAVIGQYNASAAAGYPTEVPSAWPTALQGKPTGCINDTNGNSPGYYFYQVIFAQ